MNLNIFFGKNHTLAPKKHKNTGNRQHNAQYIKLAKRLFESKDTDQRSHGNNPDVHAGEDHTGRICQHLMRFNIGIDIAHI